MVGAAGRVCIEIATEEGTSTNNLDASERPALEQMRDGERSRSRQAKPREVYSDSHTSPGPFLDRVGTGAVYRVPSPVSLCLYAVWVFLVRRSFL